MPTMPAMSSWPTRIASTAIVCASVTGNGLAAIEEPYPIAWTTQIGTPQVDQSGGVAVDGAGNAYISGLTNGDLGGTNAGFFDAFISRIDPSGHVLWTKQVGTTAFEYGISVAADVSGNSYLTGRTNGELGGARIGGDDTFLIKFDSSGNQVWSRQFGTADHDDGLGVTVDISGNVYVSGDTNGSFSGFANQGESDAFVVKFDAAGNELWAQQIGTDSTDISEAVSVDNAGNVYISGLTTGDLGGTNAGSFDVFLTKFDSSGTQVWTQQFGTASDDRGNAVAVDSVGNIYISGHTSGSLGGPNAGSRDPFLAKYDASGNQLWARQIGTAGDDRGFALAVDSTGNAFISGFTDGDLQGFNEGSSDVYLAKYDSIGNLLWTDQFGTLDTDEGRALAVDSIGNVYSGGYTNGDLDGGNAGEFDAYLAKFTVPEPAGLSLLTVGGMVLLRRERRT